jgi:hypothetical protein
MQRYARSFGGFGAGPTRGAFKRCSGRHFSPQPLDAQQGPQNVEVLFADHLAYVSRVAVARFFSGRGTNDGRVVVLGSNVGATAVTIPALRSSRFNIAGKKIEKLVFLGLLFESSSIIII